MIRRKKTRGKNWSKHGKNYEATSSLQEKHLIIADNPTGFIHFTDTHSCASSHFVF